MAVQTKSWTHSKVVQVKWNVNPLWIEKKTSLILKWFGYLAELQTTIYNQYDHSLQLLRFIQTRTPAFWGYPPPPHDYPHYWIPSQKNNRSRTENVTEQTRFSKSRSNYLEDIGQGQRSSHATHLLMLVIICTKYGKNPSRTVDATERTRFSKSTPNDLEDIGQGQRSSHATHPLMLVIICAKYGKNPSRIVDFFFQGEGQKV